MAKVLTCPACRNKGDLSDDRFFERRGKVGAKAVVKCNKCGRGLAFGMFGKAKLIPEDIWDKMMQMWDAEMDRIRNVEEVKILDAGLDESHDSEESDQLDEGEYDLINWDGLDIPPGNTNENLAFKAKALSEVLVAAIHDRISQIVHSEYFAAKEDSEKDSTLLTLQMQLPAFYHYLAQRSAYDFLPSDRASFFTKELTNNFFTEVASKYQTDRTKARKFKKILVDARTNMPDMDLFGIIPAADHSESRQSVFVVFAYGLEQFLGTEPGYNLFGILVDMFERDHALANYAELFSV